MASGFKTQVYRFYTKYRPDPQDPGKLVGEDWIEFGPPGMADRQKATEKVSRIAAVRPRDPGSLNSALEQMNDLWDFVRPLYEAWKSGQDLPETGTPLAAWNAISPEQADILKANSIKTVEQIAEMTEAGLQRVPLPGFRKMIEAAKLFLEAKDQTRVASDLLKKDEEINALKAQMSEVMASLKANDKTGELEPLDVAFVPKKRGRPPKQKAA